MGKAQEDLLLYLMIGGLSFQLLSGAIMDYIWTTMSMIQLATHIKNLSIQTPAILITAFHNIIYITNFRFHQHPKVQEILKEYTEIAYIIVEEYGTVLLGCLAVVLTVIILILTEMALRKLT